jgi:hypothetical protein
LQGGAPERASFKLSVVNVMLEQRPAVPHFWQIRVLLGVGGTVKTFDGLGGRGQDHGQLVLSRIGGVRVLVHLRVTLQQLHVEARMQPMPLAIDQFQRKLPSLGMSMRVEAG